MNQTRARQTGFTLIELLVVMTIIVILGGLGIPRLIEAMREAEMTKSKGNLENIYAGIMSYERKNGRIPGKQADGTTVSGSAFVCAVWGDPYIEKSMKNAEMFFCASLSAPPLTEENVDEWVTPENIHWAGLNQDDKNYAKGRTTAKNTSKTVIICNKPLFENEMPHAGRSLAVLYLDGHVGQFDRDQWGEDWSDEEPLSIGPESPVEALQGLQGDE
ncbi:MAG: prepilin-type N-terminal cleavage/methylation domain-containing protein [Planctomycetes bacterium]|nr:prepilin-type N-terminal cleavage/methylation domain-containing protein [Planctomycetota bacterium]